MTLRHHDHPVATGTDIIAPERATVVLRAGVEARPRPRELPPPPGPRLVQVRIGTVEVRLAAPTPPLPQPAGETTRGGPSAPPADFDAYASLRTYAGWGR